MRLLLTAVTMLGISVISGAEAASPPPGAASCSGCHAVRQSVETPVPGLIGRSSAEIEAAMAAFRTGARSASIMDRIAKGFTDEEVKAIAAWYGRQSP